MPVFENVANAPFIVTTPPVEIETIAGVKGATVEATTKFCLSKGLNPDGNVNTF